MDRLRASQSGAIWIASAPPKSGGLMSVFQPITNGSNSMNSWSLFSACAAGEAFLLYAILIAHTPHTGDSASYRAGFSSPRRCRQISGNFQLEWVNPNHDGVAIFRRGGVVSVPTNRQGSSEGFCKTASSASAGYYPKRGDKPQRAGGLATF